MKSILILIVALFLVNGLSAQENAQKNESDKSSKMSKKEAREAALTQQFKEKTAMVDGKRFVLEADFIINKNGDQSSVSSVLNFIMVDSNIAVIQVGNIVGAGVNGSGGITAKGNITSWTVDKNEKQKSLNIRMNVNTTNGFFSVSMFIPAGNNTTAKLSPNPIDFVGKLVPLEQSVVYEGRSL
jgi:hypothetical protein